MFTLCLVAVSVAASPGVTWAEPASLRADKPLALGGTDPVAYFTEGRPVAGQTGHALRWRGADWRFASEANRSAFEADPRAFAPRYAGQCALAMAEGRSLPGSPEAWEIVEGRLYLLHSAAALHVWRQGPAGLIAQADENWAARPRR